MDAARVATALYNDKDFDELVQLMKAKSINPDAPIYLQSLIDNKVDTTKFKKDPPYNLCFSNAGVEQSRGVWWVMSTSASRLKSCVLRVWSRTSTIWTLRGNDEKQIADIEDLIATPGKCDVLIVSPNTSEALTPTVEKACELCRWSS